MVAEASPTTINQRYFLLEPLGRGGMGSVYRAFDRLSGSTVALKRVLTEADQLLMASRPDDSVDLRLALAQEFQTLASLRHPNVISVLDYGFDSEQLPYFTMQLVDNAQTIIEAGAGKPLSEKIDLIVQMLQALIYIHHRGIIHRDLKPGNVLVSNGHVNVLDFGLSVSKQQIAGTSGTLAYMAPEVLMGQPADIPADLYAVGILMYELFAGRHPFDAENITTMLDAILYQPIDFSTANLDPALSSLLIRLLDKDPTNRYDNAGTVIRELAQSTGQTLASETQATRESFLQAARLVGRNAELAKLKGMLEQVLNGHGQAVLVGGESGVGKSRLLDELRTQALVRGMVVVRGQTVSEGSSPYESWFDVLRWLAISTEPTHAELAILKEVLPEIDYLVGLEVGNAPSLEPKAAQTRLFVTVVELLRRHTQPIMLVLEDLHWADSESLALLAWVTRMVSEVRVFILGSYRYDERPNLSDTLPDMDIIQLDRLNSMEIAALSESMLGESGKQRPIVQFLERETEGNVFFLIEVVRTLAEEVGALDQIGYTTLPAHVFAGGIKKIVERRLNRLAPEDRPLLQLAAVAGRTLDLEVLRASVSDIDIDAWLFRCANAAVLDVQDQRWRFAHDKLREGLLGELEPQRLRSLHRIVAQTIEAIKANVTEYAPALAYHYRAAGDTAKELHYSLLAGEQAARRYANDEAIDYFQQAIALEKDTQKQATITLKLAQIFELVGRWSEAETFYRNLLTVHANSAIETELEAALGKFLTANAKFDEALVHLEKAREAYTKQQNNKGLAEVIWSIGTLHLEHGDYAKALAAFAEAYWFAEAAGDEQLRGTIIGFTGFVHLDQGNNNDALDYLQQWLDIANRIGDRASVRRALSNMGLIYLALRNYQQAMSAQRETYHISRELGNIQFVGKSFWGMGDSYIGYGDFARAGLAFQYELRYAIDIGDRRDVAVALGKLAIARTELGAYDQASTYFEKAITLAKLLNVPYFVYEYLYYQAVLLARQKSYTEAIRINSESLQLINQVNGRQAIKFMVLVQAEMLAVDAQHKSSTEGVAALRELLKAWPGDHEQAELHYHIWLIDPTQQQSQATATALIAKLYTDTPTYDYFQQYKALTNQDLPALPVLPDLPEAERRYQVDMTMLLTQVDVLIKSLTDIP